MVQLLALSARALVTPPLRGPWWERGCVLGTSVCWAAGAVAAVAGGSLERDVARSLHFATGGQPSPCEGAEGAAMLAEGGGLEPRCASSLLAQPGRGRTTTSSGGGRPPDAHRDTPGKGGAVGLGSPALRAALLRACLCPTPPGWGTARGGLGLPAMQAVLACCHLLDSPLPSPFWLQLRSGAVPLFRLGSA